MIAFGRAFFKRTERGVANISSQRGRGGVPSLSGGSPTLKRNWRGTLSILLLGLKNMDQGSRAVQRDGEGVNLRRPIPPGHGEISPHRTPHQDVNFLSYIQKLGWTYGSWNARSRAHWCQRRTRGGGQEGRSHTASWTGFRCPCALSPTNPNLHHPIFFINKCKWLKLDFYSNPP